MYFSVLIVCLVAFPRGQAEPRTVPRRYKPIIHVTEEIDINDITFTTSAPEFDRSPSHKTAAAYYNGIKPEGLVKGSYGNVPPVVFNYGTAVPPERIYATGQPLLTKYKPYKVFKVQDAFRPVSYKSKSHDKGKLQPFDPPTTYSGPEAPKQIAKVVPISSPSPAKATTRTSSFGAQDNKNFIPSPTFSPTVLALINSENNQKLVETPDASPFTGQKAIEWPKPTKKPYRIKSSKKIPDSQQSTGVSSDDFVATSEKLEENPSSFRESPEQSESFLSEISTIKEGSSANTLDGVGESLDLKTGERVEFQMYGMDGPQSYKFGFDTGKGHNRHFRFEERDNTGKVKGHYGYLDEDGKMRIMKYEADPVTGFHAGPVEISPDEN